jgi:DNA polymerase-3 subunit epsilon
MYGLPQYKAHNALYDALATAELFLAMAAEIAPGGNHQIGSFINA